MAVIADTALPSTRLSVGGNEFSTNPLPRMRSLIIFSEKKKFDFLRKNYSRDSDRVQNLKQNSRQIVYACNVTKCDVKKVLVCGRRGGQECRSACYAHYVLCIKVPVGIFLLLLSAGSIIFRDDGRRSRYNKIHCIIFFFFVRVLRRRHDRTCLIRRYFIPVCWWPPLPPFFTVYLFCPPPPYTHTHAIAHFFPVSFSPD